MKKVEVTVELIKQLTAAQRQHTMELLASDHDRYSDDGHDYLTAALDLCARMLRIEIDDDVAELDAMLNTAEGMSDYACDGVANAFYDLEPIGLEM